MSKGLSMALCTMSPGQISFLASTHPSIHPSTNPSNFDCQTPGPQVIKKQFLQQGALQASEGDRHVIKYARTVREV